MAEAKQRAWMRPLKDDRQEMYVRVNGAYVQCSGSREMCEALLVAFEESTGERVHEITERITRFGRPRVMPGSMQLFGTAPDLSPV